MRLVTIPFSHYSEKARWALDHIGAHYEEDARVPGAHLLATVPLGGQTVPVLVDGGTVLTDSTDILLYLDRLAPGRLLPEDPAERACALDIEDYCDRRVGVPSRAWIYSEMLDHPWALGQRLGQGRPPLQRAVMPLAMTISKVAIMRSYHVTPGQPERWLDRLRESFDEIGRRLEAAGGQYLVGGRFSAADLAFAALAAPALFPPEHPVTSGDLSPFPPRVRATIEELRQTPAGRHALRVYREHRRR